MDNIDQVTKHANTTLNFMVGFGHVGGRGPWRGFEINQYSNFTRPRNGLDVQTIPAISLPYITGFHIKIIHQSIETTHQVVIIVIIIIAMLTVLFHNVICYTNSLLAHIHVNTRCLLNITCTLAAMGMILGRLECTWCCKGSTLEGSTYIAN